MIGVLIFAPNLNSGFDTLVVPKQRLQSRDLTFLDTDGAVAIYIFHNKIYKITLITNYLSASPWFLFRGVSYRSRVGFLIDLIAGISNKTAAVFFSAHRENRGLSLDKTIEIAQSNHIPIIVDAAMAVLPRRKLSRYASLGADLVAISGGKQIKGPNDTGILCGSKELVEMAKLQFNPFNGLGRGI